MSKAYCVRAVHCDHRAGNEEVYAALKRATDPLDRAWATLRRARTIAIKFNQDWPADRVILWEGQRQQLVSDNVARAVLRLLREKTSASIFCFDATAHIGHGQWTMEQTTSLAPLLREFGVEYVDGHAAPVQWSNVPGGGWMFERYPLSARLLGADAVVSVQKMKNHSFMGITLCLKNLFGLMPIEPLGRPRPYYHHLVRMPYMLADIGRTLTPALNIVDALVAQTAEEWGDGKGTGRGVDGLIAGDPVIATDACGAHLMGHAPTADWLTPPFHRDRNPLLVAAQGGFGTVDLSAIDFVSELTPQPAGAFYARVTDPEQTVVAWRRTMCEQALYYRDHRRSFEQYTGEYILLQDHEVRWHDTEGRLNLSRRQLSGHNPDHAMWLKYVDPDEMEGERYDVYERTLATDFQHR